MSAFIDAVTAIGKIAEKTPEALRAIRIFSEHVLAGENVREALLKTAEIIAVEALI